MQYLFMVSTTVGIILSCHAYMVPFKVSKRLFSIRMSTVLENTKSSPIPKVPKTAWRWPPVWPFPDDSFDAVDIDDSTIAKTNEDKSIQNQKFIDHVEYFVGKGSNVLEISIDGNFVLPTDYDYKIQYLSFIENDGTSSDIIKPLVVDINTNPKIPISSNTFDSVIFTSGIDTILNPREVFRDVWRVLKPGGVCFVYFRSKLDGILKPAKMWTTMNEEQKIWIVGSYFQFSAGEGFNSIEGFDLLSSDGKELVFEKKSDNNPYLVQAFKSFPTDLVIDSEKFIADLMHGSANMDTEDKKLMALRLNAEWKRVENTFSPEVTSKEKEIILENWVTKLSSIFEILSQIKEVVMPKPIKVMLGAMLLNQWTGSAVQKLALRRGVGLSAPDEAFWTSIATSSSNLKPRDKIILLSDLISLFGTPVAEDKEEESEETLPEMAALTPLVLQELLNVIKIKFPEMEPGDTELLACELLASDFILPLVESSKQSPTVSPSTVAQQIAGRLIRYVNAVDAATLTSILKERKAIQQQQLAVASTDSTSSS